MRERQKSQEKDCEPKRERKRNSQRGGEKKKKKKEIIVREGGMDGEAEKETNREGIKLERKESNKLSLTILLLN